MDAGDPGAEKPSDLGQRYRATVAYDGTGYSGFQIQVARPTIQGALEKALLQASRQAVRVQGAGRTDAGVHARGQVISFTSAWRHGPAVLQRALNALLPEDIAVADLAQAPASFHARYSAWRRLYVYTVVENAWRLPLLERYAHRVPGPLRLDAMDEAARALEGVHDFAAFGQPTQGPGTVRHVWLARWEQCAPSVGGGRADWQAPCYQFRIEANGFLRGMVRRIVGTLLEVGSGTRSVSGFVDTLMRADIARAAPAVPPCGLCLWSVTYPPETAQDTT